jgi:protein-tyrosine kinase
MGRVSDAMHRAGQGSGNAVPGPPVLDVADLAATVYQGEVPVGEPPRRNGVPVTLLDTDGAGAVEAGRFGSALKRKIVVDHDMIPASREQYRRLAATLHAAQGSLGLRVVMIGSAVAGEGKTLTASNLGLTLSESYQRRVVLIDGDLRRPSLHTVFKVDGAPGLVEGLASDEDKPLTLRHVSSRLAVLPAGRPTADPMAGLISPRMRRVIAEAREMFDWVIIDTPPVGLLTDAKLLAAMTDGTVMIVKAGSTPCELVRRAVDAIGPERLLGVVLNVADIGADGYGYAYYGRYREARATEA